MPHLLDDDIRIRLARYVRGEWSLDEFGDWFVPTTWDVDQSPDAGLKDLVYDILLRVAEYSNGDCREDELKHLLYPLAAGPSMSAASEE